MNRHRVVTPDGITERVNRERVFETVLAVDMSTKTPWLGFTVEAITSPFSEDNVVELEFENLVPDGSRFLDDASHWSVSFVFVIPVAPF